MIGPSTQIIKNRCDSSSPALEESRPSPQMMPSSEDAVMRQGLVRRALRSQRPEPDLPAVHERKLFFEPRRDLLEQMNTDPTDIPFYKNLKDKNKGSSLQKSVLEKIRCSTCTNKYVFASNRLQKLPPQTKPFSPVKVLISEKDANHIRKETKSFFDGFVPKTKNNNSKDENHIQYILQENRKDHDVESGVVKVDKQIIEGRSGVTQTARKRNRLNYQEMCPSSPEKNIPVDDTNSKVNVKNNGTNNSKDEMDIGSKKAFSPNYIDLTALSTRVADDSRMSNDNSADEVMEENSNHVEADLNNFNQLENNSKVIDKNSLHSILNTSKSASPFPGGLLPSASVESFKSSGSKCENNKEKVFLEIKNSSMEASKKSDQTFMSVHSNLLDPSKDVMARRRKQLMEYVMMRLDHNDQLPLKRQTNWDPEAQEKLCRRRVIRGIYEVFFPSSSLRPSSRLSDRFGGRLVEKLELRAKINAKKRRKELLAEVFKEPIPQNRLRKRSSFLPSQVSGNQDSSLEKINSGSMDIKGPLKYLFDWKTRLQQQVQVDK